MRKAYKLLVFGFNADKSWAEVKSERWLWLLAKKTTRWREINEL